MPISRPLLIVLVAAVLALVGFYATQGSRDSVDSAPVVVTPPPEAGKADEPSALAKVDKSEAQAQKPAKPSKSDPNVSQPQSAKPDPKPDAAPKAKAKATKAKAAARPVAGPVAVRRAIDRKQRVVLFFGTPRGADDRATAVAAALQRSRGVVVVLEPLENLVKYRELIGGLGISQAPAVVIVGKDGAARLVEGYVDPATLAQEVADAR